MLYWIFYYIIKVFCKIFVPFKVVGRENIPSSGNFIFACNHLSNLDPILVGLSVYRRLSYMAKDSLFANKVLSFILRNGGAFPIKRNSADIRSLREAIRRIKAGSHLLVFPEGTRAAGKEQEELPSGVGFLVSKTHVPVIPVNVVGSDKALPPGARWFTRYPITVIIGKPIVFSPAENYPQIVQHIMQEIYSLP